MIVPNERGPHTDYRGTNLFAISGLVPEIQAKECAPKEWLVHIPNSLQQPLPLLHGPKTGFAVQRGVAASPTQPVFETIENLASESFWTKDALASAAVSDNWGSGKAILLEHTLLLVSQELDH